MEHEQLKRKYEDFQKICLQKIENYLTKIKSMYKKECKHRENILRLLNGVLTENQQNHLFKTKKRVTWMRFLILYTG